MCSWFILLHFFLPLCLTTTSLCSLARDCIKNALKIRFFVHRVPDYVSKRETNWKPERCFVRSGKMILSVCTYVCAIKLRVHYALIITRAGGWEEKLVVLCLCPSVVSSSSFVASHFLSTLVASGVVCLFVFMNVCMLGLASFRLRCLFNVILFQVFLSDFLQKFFLWFLLLLVLFSYLLRLLLFLWY